MAECSFDGGPAEACGALFSVDLSGRDGPHQLTVLARDAAGNTSPDRDQHLRPRHPGAGRTRAHAHPGRGRMGLAVHARARRPGRVLRGRQPVDAPARAALAGGPPDRTVRFEVRAVDQASNRSDVTGTTVTPTLGTGPGSARRTRPRPARRRRVGPVEPRDP